MNPTDDEKEALLPPLALVQALNELLPPEPDLPIDPALYDDIQFTLDYPEEVINIPEEDSEEDRVILTLLARLIRQMIIIL